MKAFNVFSSPTAFDDAKYDRHPYAVSNPIHDLERASHCGYK